MSYGGAADYETGLTGNEKNEMAGCYQWKYDKPELLVVPVIVSSAISVCVFVLCSVLMFFVASLGIVSLSQTNQYIIWAIMTCVCSITSITCLLPLFVMVLYSWGVAGGIQIGLAVPFAFLGSILAGWWYISHDMWVSIFVLVVWLCFFICCLGWVANCAVCSHPYYQKSRGWLVSTIYNSTGITDKLPKGVMPFMPAPAKPAEF